MKTQISNLRSGAKKQILNPQIDYKYNSGSNHEEVKKIWGKVIAENPIQLTAIIKGITVNLTANWSLSKKSVTYWGAITKEELENIFKIKAAKKEQPYILIQNGNEIVVHNGKNSFKYICPSLVEIL